MITDILIHSVIRASFPRGEPVALYPKRGGRKIIGSVLIFNGLAGN